MLQLIHSANFRSIGRTLPDVNYQQNIIIIITVSVNEQ